MTTIYLIVAGLVILLGGIWYIVYKAKNEQKMQDAMSHLAATQDYNEDIIKILTKRPVVKSAIDKLRKGKF